MDIIKIALTAVIGALLALKMKQYQGEYSVYIVLGTGILLLVFCCDAITSVIQLITQLGDMLNGQAVYLKILVKLIGIAYICEFASGICVDAGYQALAGQVRLLGKLAILVSAIPLFTCLMETIEEVFS